MPERRSLHGWASACEMVTHTIVLPRQQPHCPFPALIMSLPPSLRGPASVAGRGTPRAVTPQAMTPRAVTCVPVAAFPSLGLSKTRRLLRCCLPFLAPPASPRELCWPLGRATATDGARRGGWRRLEHGGRIEQAAPVHEYPRHTSGRLALPGRAAAPGSPRVPARERGARHLPGCSPGPAGAGGAEGLPPFLSPARSLLPGPLRPLHRRRVARSEQPGGRITAAFPPEGS